MWLLRGLLLVLQYGTWLLLPLLRLAWHTLRVLLYMVFDELLVLLLLLALMIVAMAVL